MIISGSKAWSHTELRRLNTYDRFVAYLLDKTISKSGYSFKETFVKINSADNNQLSNSLSIGEALVINEKLNRNIAKDKFANSIITKIYVDDEFLGDFIFQWHPSKSFLMFALGFLLYRFDQAYLWPQFLVDKFPSLINDKITNDPLIIEWNKMSALTKMSKRPIEFENLALIFQKIQLINPSVDSMKLDGFIGTKSDLTTNTTRFLLNFQIQFPETMKCIQQIESDYNPFRKKLSQIKGFYNCESTDPDIAKINFQSEEF